MVTLFAWTAHKLACSSNPTRKASPTSWRAMMALLWNLWSVLMPCAISHTTLWNGILLTNRSVLVRHFLIFLKVFIPLLTLPILFFMVCHPCFSFPFSQFTPHSFSSFPSPSPLFPLIFLSFLSLATLALLALTFFIFSLSALINVFVFCAISRTRTISTCSLISKLF